MITDIANAVVAAINASGLLTPPATAVRRIIPSLDIEVTRTLQVLVITPATERKRQNRVAFRNDHTIQIGVLQLLDSVEPAAVDPMILLTEQLTKLRYAEVTSGSDVAEYLDSRSAPLYDSDKLEMNNQYVGVVTVRFVEFDE